MSIATGQQSIHAADQAPVMDITKHDMTVTYGGRTFAIRAFHDEGVADGPGWRAVIIENRTPLRHELASNPSPAGCFADVVRFLTGAVDPRAAVLPT